MWAGSTRHQRNAPPAAGPGARSRVVLGGAALGRLQERAPQSFTYSKSISWELMPRRGGAIQSANLPGSVTARMSDFT